MEFVKPDRHNINLFNNGKHYQAYKMFGAHLVQINGKFGVHFTLWAPNAKEVRVVGNFNSWNGKNHSMINLDNTGVWTLFIPGIKEGELYKYEIYTYDNQIIMKSDPYAFYSEKRPNTASIVYSLNKYIWQDQNWQENKLLKNNYEQPLLIYEVHLGSWKRKADGSFLSYREIAFELVDYVVDLGYTHIEIMPIMEHPYDGSWGYQITGYYSVTSRYGRPEDFMFFIDYCHQKGIGVILDWVPGHFCKDLHGLRKFDGTNLYEYDDINKSENRVWGTLNFDLSKHQVWSFLISNAAFWFEIYHIDGLRIDAVSNMLYLDYGKGPGEWKPNIFGGNQNLEAIAFMKKLNETIFDKYSNPLMIAEESTAFPAVTKPTYLDGLGYNYKWNMGWMNDILKYMELDPIYRKWHHTLITFSFMYAFSENYILPLSHDEVVHGKKSLLAKMPGDYYQKFAGLRALYGYMMAHPGKKLLFMGGEFGQFTEWNVNKELDWNVLDFEMHWKLKHYVRELNVFYQNNKSLWQLDFEWSGFHWIDANDYEQSVICFIRCSKNKEDFLIVICNFTPVLRERYRVGIPIPGIYKEVFNSDATEYGGSGILNTNNLITEYFPWHNQPYSLELTLPPLSAIFLKCMS